MTQHSDEDISRLLNNDDSTAIKILHGLYYQMMYSIALRILKSHAEAQDVVQDLFIKLWNGRNNLNVQISFGAYLRRAASNQSISALRKKNKMIFVDEPIVAETYQPIEANELEKAIEEVINQLPEKCRIVFILSRHEGLKNKEIAEQLQISIKAVEKQITKALKLMRSQLKPFIPD